MPSDGRARTDGAPSRSGSAIACGPSPSSRSPAGTALAYFSTTGAGDGHSGLPSLAQIDDHRGDARGGGDRHPDLVAVTPPARRHGHLLRHPRRRNRRRYLPDLGRSGGRHDLRRQRPRTRHHTYTVTADLALLDVDQLAGLGEITVGAATHLALSAASTTPIAGATDNLTITRPDSAGERRHDLHRLPQPHLLRRLGEPRRNRADGRQQLRHRDRLRRRDRDHVHHRRRQRDDDQERRDEALPRRSDEVSVSDGTISTSRAAGA